MKKYIVIVPTVIIAVSLFMATQRMRKESDTKEQNAPTMSASGAVHATSSIGPAVSRSESAPNEVADVKVQASLLEQEIAALNHEIERGGYIDKINDPSTSDVIKEELRARLRLMVRRTIDLTNLNIRRLDSEASL